MMSDMRRQLHLRKTICRLKLRKMMRAVQMGSDISLFHEYSRNTRQDRNKEYSGFVKDDLVVQIYNSNYDWGKHVSISYYSIQLMKQLDEQDQNNEKERQDSINSGL